MYVPNFGMYVPKFGIHVPNFEIENTALRNNYYSLRL